MLRFLVVSSTLLVANFTVHAKACDIGGVWDHSAKPARLLVDVNKAQITVYSHDNNSKAVVSCFKCAKTNIRFVAMGCADVQCSRRLVC